MWLDQRIQCSAHYVGKGLDVLHDVHQLDYHEKSDSAYVYLVACFHNEHE